MLKALLSGPDYMDDPFIPQRGRRTNRTTFRRKRNANDDKIRQLLERTLQAALRSGSDYVDDPFIPQRGRRSDSLQNKDTFLKKRSPSNEAEIRQLIQRTLHAALSGSDYINDPFIPQRGRRGDKRTKHFFAPPAFNRQRWAKMPGKSSLETNK